MGNGLKIPNFPAPSLTPLPGQRSKHPVLARDIDEYAVSREATENFIGEMDAIRGIGDRGHHRQSLRLLAERLAKSATSDVDLGNKLNAHLSRSKSPQVRNEKDAEFLVRLAFENFSKMHKITDPDFVWIWTGWVLEKHKVGVKKSRRKRIGEIVDKIEESPSDLDRILWNKRVQRLADEANVSFGYAELLLAEYQRRTGLQLPTVNPRLYPGIQGPVSAQRTLFATTVGVTIGVPLAASAGGLTLAALIKNPILAWELLIVLFDGLAVVELFGAIRGRSIVSGDKLETWERIVSFAIAILPFVKYLKHAGPLIVSAAKLSKEGVKSAKFVAAMAVDSGRDLVATVRLAKSLGAMTQRSLFFFRRRVMTALRTKNKSLALNELERTFVEELDRAVGQFGHGRASVLSRTAKIKDINPKNVLKFVDDFVAIRNVPARGTILASDVLVGTNRAKFRLDAARTIRNTPNHYLKKLLDAEGQLQSGFGKSHDQLWDNPALLEMGHIASKKSREAERIVLQSAASNQFDRVTVEGLKGSHAFVRNEAVSIASPGGSGAIGVEMRTAKDWVDAGLLEKSVFDSAPRIIF